MEVRRRCGIYDKTLLEVSALKYSRMLDLIDGNIVIELISL